MKRLATKGFGSVEFERVRLFHEAGLRRALLRRPKDVIAFVFRAVNL